MLHTSKLRGEGRNGFMRRLNLALAALILLVLLPAAASAYTVVLRNGRSVQIPASFSVTSAGITYEHSPGLYVTIQMTSIDISATERANNEPQGSLLNRAATAKPSAAPVSSPPAAGSQPTRTLTDRELEDVRMRREASEATYERRRAELGLPSVEESRRQREEETRRLNEMAAEREREEIESESYWRERASELRTAIASNDAEINYVRSELSEMSDNYPTVAFTAIAPFPFVARVPGGFNRPGFPNAPRRGPRTGGIGFGGGSTRGRVFFNPRGPGHGRRGFGRRGVAVLPLPIYAPNGYDYSYEQSALRMRLRELEAERASLQARWRLLEEEARRTGAPPGWLRP